MKPMRIAYRTDSILFILNSSFTISIIRLSTVKSANILILLEKYVLSNETCTHTVNHELLFGLFLTKILD